MKIKNWFFVLMILVLGALAYGQQRVIRLNTHHQAPLTYIDSAGVLSGEAMQPVLYALQEMDWKVELNFLLWARAQQQVKDGVVDGFFAAAGNAEREKFAVRSASIATQTINWYLLADSTVDPNAADFRSTARVGGYTGANMLVWLLDNGYNVTGQPAHPDQLFMMLLYDRFDACLANNNNFDNFIAANPQYIGKFRAVKQSVNELYVYFSHGFIDKNPGFLDAFNLLVFNYRTAR